MSFKHDSIPIYPLVKMNTQVHFLGRGESGRSWVKVDGPTGWKWTVQTTESGRSWIKVDGPKHQKVDGPRKWTVQKPKVDGPKRTESGRSERTESGRSDDRKYMNMNILLFNNNYTIRLYTTKYLCSWNSGRCSTFSLERHFWCYHCNIIEVFAILELSKCSSLKS